MIMQSVEETRQRLLTTCDSPAFYMDFKDVQEFMVRAEEFVEGTALRNDPTEQSNQVKFGLVFTFHGGNWFGVSFAAQKKRCRINGRWPAAVIDPEKISRSCEFLASDLLEGPRHPASAGGDIAAEYNCHSV